MSRDETKLVVHGTQATLALTTTFGFSTNRVCAPSLHILTRDGVRKLELPPNWIGEEYSKTIANLACAVRRPGGPLGLWAELDAIVTALSLARSKTRLAIP